MQRGKRVGTGKCYCTEIQRLTKSLNVKITGIDAKNKTGVLNLGYKLR
jgi:hypothetical protein